MKVAAAVLGASLLFFVGVLTGAGRREAVAPPTAIPLGAANAPAAGSGAPDGATLRTTTTTARTGATAPATGTSPTSPTGPTPSTATPGATAPSGTTAASSTTTSTGQVQQVDNQIDCTSSRKQGKGKREPCPSSTTASTSGAPGGGRNG